MVFAFSGRQEPPDRTIDAHKRSSIEQVKRSENPFKLAAVASPTQEPEKNEFTALIWIAFVKDRLDESSMSHRARGKAEPCCMIQAKHRESIEPGSGRHANSTPISSCSRQ